MERTNSCVDTMDNPGIKTDKTQLEIDNFVVKDFERGLCMGKRERIGSVTFRWTTVTVCWSVGASPFPTQAGKLYFHCYNQRTCFG